MAELPAENASIGKLLGERVSLLDCTATQAVLTDELKLAAPPGGWHLSDSRAQVELVFRANGSTYSNETRRLITGAPNTGTLIETPDVPGLIYRLIETEAVERVHLPGLIEFRSLGGNLDDLQGDVTAYMRVMEHDMRRFRFAPLGIDMVRYEHLVQLREGFDPRHKKVSAFTDRALQ